MLLKLIKVKLYFIYMKKNMLYNKSLSIRILILFEIEKSLRIFIHSKVVFFLLNDGHAGNLFDKNGFYYYEIDFKVDFFVHMIYLGGFFKIGRSYCKSIEKFLFFLKLYFYIYFCINDISKFDTFIYEFCNTFFCLLSMNLKITLRK